MMTLPEDDLEEGFKFKHSADDGYVGTYAGGGITPEPPGGSTYTSYSGGDTTLAPGEGNFYKITDANSSIADYATNKINFTKAGLPFTFEITITANTLNGATEFTIYIDEGTTSKILIFAAAGTGTKSISLTSLPPITTASTIALNVDSASSGSGSASGISWIIKTLD